VTFFSLVALSSHSPKRRTVEILYFDQTKHRVELMYYYCYYWYRNNDNVLKLQNHMKLHALSSNSIRQSHKTKAQYRTNNVSYATRR